MERVNSEVTNKSRNSEFKRLKTEDMIRVMDDEQRRKV